MKNTKKVFIVLFVVLLAVIGSVSAWAVSAKRQTFPTGLPVLTAEEAAQPGAKQKVSAEVDSAAAQPADAQESPNTKENLDTQESIFNRMLNSPDYFDTAAVCFDLLEPHMTESKTVSCEVNFVTGESHESVAPGSAELQAEQALPDLESFSDGEEVATYRNTERTYYTKPAFQRISAEEELGEDVVRVYVDPADQENGTPTYVYRQDPTNTFLSGSYCLFPQGLAFGYLTDFSLWEITGSTEYLGRECLELSGTTTASCAEKMDAETFTMCVDKATGILLMYEAKDKDGAVTSDMNVKEISVDSPKAIRAAKKSQEKYEDYKLIQ